MLDERRNSGSQIYADRKGETHFVIDINSATKGDSIWLIVSEIPFAIQNQAKRGSKAPRTLQFRNFDTSNGCFLTEVTLVFFQDESFVESFAQLSRHTIRKARNWNAIAGNTRA